MKLLFTFFTFTLFHYGLLSQNSLKLELNHMYKGEPFVLNQQFVDNEQRIVTIERARYYLSSMKITHDGGMETVLDGVYILGVTTKQITA